MKRASMLFSALVLVATAFASVQESSLAGLEHLRDPKVSTRKNEKMLVVEARGDPNLVGTKAFRLLFQLYYSLKETPKGAGQAAPRARWPLSLETPRSEWIGLYGLPVPETIRDLPPHQATEGLKASLTTWEYGEVAEILHVGPYDKEQPTMRRLQDSAHQLGYEILSGHEEEYIKGPTMTGPGDPEKYLTIIRYRVQKASKK